MRPTRITPAPAGNTRHRQHSRISHQDHPRACGKHYMLPLEATPTAGSPPRLRETPGMYSAYTQRSGITPAPAGNTELSLVATTWKQDHPRACGKH